MLENNVSRWLKEHFPVNQQDDTRKKKLLRIILYPFLGFSSVVLVFVLMVQPLGIVGTDVELAGIINACVILLLASISILYANRKYRSEISSIMFVMILHFITVISDTPEQIVNGRSLFLFAIPIILSSLLVGPRFTFVSCFINSLVVIGFWPILGTPLPNIIAISEFILLSIVTYLSSKSTDDARKELDESESRAEAEEERAKLYLDLMSHDIGNRHQGVFIATDLLSEITNTAETESILEKIRESIVACKSIRQQIERTNELYTAPIEVVDLIETLIDTIEVFQNTHPTIVVKENFSIEEAKVRADKHLPILFMTILENAVTHNPETPLEISINIREIEGYYNIEIIDNGRGIAPHRLYYLFDLERRFGGVGLHICHSLVRKYSGTICAHDAHTTMGAAFEIQLPVVSE